MRVSHKRVPPRSTAPVHPIGPIDRVQTAKIPASRRPRRGSRSAHRQPRLSLSPVTTVAGDDKPYLPDRGTNECDKPGWCSGPSYDPVTVVTRVQIPLRASPRFGVCRCLPGWCSGPSYDPVTVVTRVQIPLRAFSTNNSASAASRSSETLAQGFEPYQSRAASNASEPSDSGSNPAPGVFCRRQSTSEERRDELS